MTDKKSIRKLKPGKNRKIQISKTNISRRVIKGIVINHNQKSLRIRSLKVKAENDKL